MHGSCGCSRSAEDLAASLSRSIDRLGDQLIEGVRSLGAGVQYSLRVTQAGVYMDVRGNPVQLQPGDIWKYGETTQISTDLSLNMNQWRYSGSQLRASNMEFVVEYAGTQIGSKFRQAIKLRTYVFLFGTLPPGNKTTW